jgi:tetratricopeptide (TPR) repeat protein
MFSNSIRVILIVVSILLGSVSLSKGNLLSGVLGFTSTGLLIYGYFRYNLVHLLWRYLKQGNLTKAQEILDSIKFPNLLGTQQKAYYQFSKGYLASNHSQNDLAEDCFLQALQIGLRTTNDMAIANLELAKIYHEQGNPGEAYERLQKAKELPHNEELNPLIEKLTSNP